MHTDNYIPIILAGRARRSPYPRLVVTQFNMGCMAQTNLYVLAPRPVRAQQSPPFLFLGDITKQRGLLPITIFKNPTYLE